MSEKWKHHDWVWREEKMLKLWNALFPSRDHPECLNIYLKIKHEPSGERSARGEEGFKREAVLPWSHLLLPITLSSSLNEKLRKCAECRSSAFTLSPERIETILVRASSIPCSLVALPQHHGQFLGGCNPCCGISGSSQILFLS